LTGTGNDFERGTAFNGPDALHAAICDAQAEGVITRRGEFHPDFASIRLDHISNPSKYRKVAVPYLFRNQFRGAMCGKYPFEVTFQRRDELQARRWSVFGSSLLRRSSLGATGSRSARPRPGSSIGSSAIQPQAHK